MLKIDAMRLISIYGQESNYTTWRLAKMNLAIRGIDAQGMKGQPRHSATLRNSESVPMSSSHVFGQTAQTRSLTDSGEKPRVTSEVCWRNS